MGTLDASDRSHVGQICNLPVSSISLGFGQITNLPHIKRRLLSEASLLPVRPSMEALLTGKKTGKSAHPTVPSSYRSRLPPRGAGCWYEIGLMISTACCNAGPCCCSEAPAGMNWYGSGCVVIEWPEMPVEGTMICEPADAGAQACCAQAG